MNRIFVILIVIAFFTNNCKSIKNSHSSNSTYINHSKRYCTPPNLSGFCLELFDDKTFELINYSDQGNINGYGDFVIFGDSLKLTYRDAFNYLPPTCTTYKPLISDSIHINIKLSGEPYITSFYLKEDIHNLDRSDHKYLKRNHILKDSFQISIPYYDNLHFVIDPTERAAPQILSVFERGLYTIECNTVTGPKRYYSSKDKGPTFHIISMNKDEYKFSNLTLFNQND